MELAQSSLGLDPQIPAPFGWVAETSEEFGPAYLLSELGANPQEFGGFGKVGKPILEA